MMRGIEAMFLSITRYIRYTSSISYSSGDLDNERKKCGPEASEHKGVHTCRGKIVAVWKCTSRRRSYAALWRTVRKNTDIIKWFFLFFCSLLNVFASTYEDRGIFVVEIYFNEGFWNSIYCSSSMVLYAVFLMVVSWNSVSLRLYWGRASCTALS